MGAMTFARASGSNADKAESVYGEYRVVRGVLTFSATYATGGDTIPLASVGLQEIRKVFVDTELAGAAEDSGLSVRLGGTPSAPTLEAYDTLNTEVTNATSLATRAVPVWLLGKG